MSKKAKWQFWIDVGGTFTDALCRAPDGTISTCKVLSSTTVNGEEAPVTCIRQLMGKTPHEDIGPIEVRLGTTRGTNALLEREGAKTCFVTTSGFKDLLAIGYQNRPKLFSLDIQKPRPLYDMVIEIDERLDAFGKVLTPVDLKSTKENLKKAFDAGFRSIAVALLHSYRNNLHEDAVCEIAEELGFEQISISSRLSGLQRIVPRADTTVVDAYLTPTIKDYIKNVQASIPAADIKLMASSGALVVAESFVGKDSILSGPAGGVVGAARVSKEAGFDKIIGFDMGGTSTDVCRYSGEFERRHEMELADPERDAGVRLVAPMLSIETVAAGGGSICWFDGITLRVGPKSAGANPGPACYGNSGPLTVTDLNLFLDRISEEFFPFPLDKSPVQKQLTKIRDSIARSGQKSYTLNELAEGFLSVAISTMAEPIKKVSIAKGHDPRDYTLVSFGGAGAQHSCKIADELGIKTIFQHPYSSVLSAYGIGMADIGKFRSKDFVGKYSPSLIKDAMKEFAKTERELKEELQADSSLNLKAKRSIDFRYLGQDSVITVPEPLDGDWERAFRTMHQTLFGFSFPERAIEARAIHLELLSSLPFDNTNTKLKKTELKAKKSFHLKAGLKPGDVIEGPSKIIEPQTTVVVETEWKATITNEMAIILERTARKSEHSVSEDYDPINLTLFNNQFVSIAEQMGATLQKTAISVNIKERLDFSCALFTNEGDLVANAPHIPVHLGAMGSSVKFIIQNFAPEEGDVFITNDPHNGGSHLPDVTVISPFFDSGKVLFYTAARAHHAEIGGITPGSMPPFSTSLAEEGVLIRAFRLVSNNRESEEELRKLLETASYPSRSVDDNISDINAQIAACSLGHSLLKAMLEQFGTNTVTSYMSHIQKAARSKMENALSIPGEFEFSDAMDDGTPISVKISIKENKATVDFSGTGKASKGNLNANEAIVRSSVLYCFRCLIDEDIPLNEGVLDPIEVIIPKGSILAPDNPDSAVVGGNVETSQRVTDVVLAALGLSAASQGTMNNLIFGSSDSAFGYYETICGGAGAGPDFDGADAVHTNMTNTRITDPEVLEERFPVRLHRFEIREDSGGKGRRKGGNGVIRKLEFLAPLEVSLLCSRRTSRPFGLSGGEAGLAGENILISENSRKKLRSSDYFKAKKGDVLEIKTPSGGGYGR